MLFSILWKKKSKNKKNPDGEYEKAGKVITIFLQNKPLRTEYPFDEETLINICPGTEYWGTSLTALNTFLGYLKKQRGLPGVSFDTFFPIFKTKRIQNQLCFPSKASVVEDKYAKLGKNKILKCKANEQEIDDLARDQSYKDQADLDFGGTRIQIILKLYNFYKQI